MKTTVELAGGPDQHVGRDSGAPKSLTGCTASAEFRRRVIGDDQHNVVITVGTRVSPGDGAEQVGPFRPVGFRQEPYGSDRAVSFAFGASRTVAFSGVI